MDGNDPGLIDRNPVLSPITKPFEAHPRIALKVLLDLLDVQPTAVPVMQGLGQVPVVQGHPGLNISGKEAINERCIKCDSLLIDRIFTATQWDDTRPRNRKAIGPCTILREKIEVFLEFVAVITGNIAIDTVGDGGL